jgi:DNA-binding NtrC family response regulator
VIETGEFERVGSSRTRKVDVRILSATNADPREQVAAGRFREDLFFRLNTVEIRLPPLHDREDDIRLLAMHFLGEHSRRYHKNLTGFSDTAMDLLLEYRWPGNVRELDHAVERAVWMTQGSHIQPADLGLPGERQPEQRLEDVSLEEVERLLVQKALGRFRGNVSQAAQALGLSRSALYRRMERYGLGESSDGR